MKRLRLTGKRSKHFLEVLAETGNVTLAARAVGFSRGGVYAHRQIDEAFAKAWEEAEEIAADRLEAEAWRRGVEGVAEPLVSAGKLVRDDDDTDDHSPVFGPSAACAVKSAPARAVQRSRVG
jgi:hypothetical protein